MSMRILLPISLVGAALLAGCGGNVTSGAVATSVPAATVTPAASVTSTPAGGTGAPASVPATPHATLAGLPRCHTAGLSAAITGSSGAAGTIIEEVQLHNTAGSTCQMFGFPGLGLLDGGGRALPTTVVRGGGMLPTSSTPALLTVAAGASVYFEFTYSDVPTGAPGSPCPLAGRLEITPPDEQAFLTVVFASAPCAGGTLNASPVHQRPQLG